MALKNSGERRKFTSDTVRDIAMKSLQSAKMKRWHGMIYMVIAAAFVACAVMLALGHMWD